MWTVKQQVADLEARLQRLSTAEKLASHPVIKEWTDYLVTESKRCTALLTHDRNLSDVERQVLFEKRELCDHFSSLFNRCE